MRAAAPRTADVCIVGCGSTGSIAALALSRSGASVIALEAGPIWEVEDFVPDELESDAFKNTLGPLWNKTPVTWHDAMEGTSGVKLGLNMMNGVGGSGLHYAGHAWRFHPEDFKVRSTVTNRYGPEAVPGESSVVDWPIDYDDLEPYYTLVERQIGVSGRAGVLAAATGHGGNCVQSGGNPFEGPRSGEYPMPPLRLHRLGRLVSDAAGRMGMHPFMGPTAINSVGYAGRNATNYCGFCLGYACRIQAKGSANNAVLPEALFAGNLDIVADARVLALEMDQSGRISGVRYLRDGREHVLRARVVLLGAYTFENYRILRTSACSYEPNGIGGSSGHLGRHFMVHRFDSVGAHFPNQELNRFAGPQGQRIVIDDYNADNFDHSGLGFIQGAQIFVPNEFHPIQDTAVIPPSWPSWGKGYKDLLKREWNSLGRLMTNVEVLPYPDNRLDLEPDRRDELGIPMVRATVSMYENERRLVTFITDRMTEIAFEAGADEVWPLNSVVVPSQHDGGGTRMGEDPASSVVDPWGKVHSVDNLYMLGPSTFPTASGLNPSMTAQALAWRTADRVVLVL